MNCPECGIPSIWLASGFFGDSKSLVWTYECENFHRFHFSLGEKVKIKKNEFSNKVERWPEDEKSNPKFTGKVEKWRGFNACVSEEAGE